MPEEQGVDVAGLEQLAQRAAGGDVPAQRDWLKQLSPLLSRLVRSSSGMRTAEASEDHVADVVASALGKLSKGVRTYPSWKAVNPDKSVLDWVRIVTRNATRDHLRARLGPRPAAAQPSVKRLLNEFASSEGLDDRGHRPPFTTAETARELYEFARKHLPALQFATLARWLEDQSFEEIARALEIEAEQASRLLHAGIAALRRRFREKADSAVRR